jgi:hypothetical protein
VQALALSDVTAVNVDTVSCLQGDAGRRSVAALLAVARDCATKNGLGKGVAATSKASKRGAKKKAG